MRTPTTPTACAAIRCCKPWRDAPGSQPTHSRLDSTEDRTHGQQAFTFYNAHYDSYMYHPLLVFEGTSGVLRSSRLRPGNAMGSRQAVELLRPLVRRLRAALPGRPIALRADAAFGAPEVLDYAEYAALDELTAFSRDAAPQVVGVRQIPESDALERGRVLAVLFDQAIAPDALPDAAAFQLRYQDGQAAQRAAVPAAHTLLRARRRARATAPRPPPPPSGTCATRRSRGPAAGRMGCFCDSCTPSHARGNGPGRAHPVSGRPWWPPGHAPRRRVAARAPTGRGYTALARGWPARCTSSGMSGILISPLPAVVDVGQAQQAHRVADGEPLLAQRHRRQRRRARRRQVARVECRCCTPPAPARSPPGPRRPAPAARCGSAPRA